MSWDIMTNEVRKCECGKGKVRYISEMDDWNRIRSAEYIDCKECYNKYKLYQSKRNECGNVAKHDYTKCILVEKV